MSNDGWSETPYKKKKKKKSKRERLERDLRYWEKSFDQWSIELKRDGHTDSVAGIVNRSRLKVKELKKELEKLNE